MSEARYQLVAGEVRKRIEGQNPTDWPTILHDHGGATCSGCIENTMNELNALANRVRELEEAVRVLAAARVETQREIDESAGGPVCGQGPNNEAADANPIAKAAIDAAGKDQG